MQWDQFLLSELQEALEFDSLPSSHSIVLHDICNNNEINTVYDVIAYEKGGSVVRMMWQFLGRENLRGAMKVRYLIIYCRHTVKQSLYENNWIRK